MPLGISTLLQSFNQTTDQWLQSLDRYSMGELLRQPIPGGWSMGQLYVHIVTETEYYVSQMIEALHISANLDGVKTSEGEAMFHNNEFPDVALDSPTNANMPQPISKEQLYAGLGRNKEQVNRTYANFRPESASGKTQHPGLGYFSSLDWLQFADMHMRHHLRQKARIDSALSGR